MDIHLTPAYGRDYKSAAAAVADWKKGKDFVLNSPINFGGMYCSIKDLLELRKQGVGEVWIRYDQLQRITKVSNSSAP